MMTMGEELIEQGRQKGILEARAEDIVRILTCGVFTWMTPLASSS